MEVKVWLLCFRINYWDKSCRLYRPAVFFVKQGNNLIAGLLTGMYYLQSYTDNFTPSFYDLAPHHRSVDIWGAIRAFNRMAISCKDGWQTNIFCSRTIHFVGLYSFCMTKSIYFSKHIWITTTLLKWVPKQTGRNTNLDNFSVISVLLKKNKISKILFSLFQFLS